MSEQSNPVYKAIKTPKGEGFPRDSCYGWIQVDKLLGADEKYGIVKNGIYKVLSYGQGSAGIETPKNPFNRKLREMISDQYHWVSTDVELNLTPEDEEFKIGDRVMLKEDYMRFKYGAVMKIQDVKPDGSETLVQLVCPNDSFWIYTHRIEKF